jgi:hypothetical protein
MEELLTNVSPQTPQTPHSTRLVIAAMIHYGWLQGINNNPTKFESGVYSHSVRRGEGGRVVCEVYRSVLAMLILVPI